MKPIHLLSALFVFSLRAQAPVPLAHGDVPGEPHHHLKIENTYVRAYYVEVPPHGETQLHQHDHDYVFVTLGASDVTNAVLGRPEVRLKLKDAETRFTRGGFAHVARNNSDAPFRNVTIEFLRPQGETHNSCPGSDSGVPGPCEKVPFPRGARYAVVPWLETAEMRLDFVELLPRAKFTEPAATLDRFLVVLDQSNVEVQLPGYTATQLGTAGLLWLPAGPKQSFKNLRHTPSRFLLLSFKDSAAPR